MKPVDTAEPACRAWQDAALAGLLFAIDPAGTGVALRAGAGPVRDQWLAALRALMAGQPWRRLPLHIRDERLLGGLDLAATLQAGRAVAQRGVLADSHGGVFELGGEAGGAGVAAIEEPRPARRALLGHQVRVVAQHQVVDDRNSCGHRPPSCVQHLCRHR